MPDTLVPPAELRILFIGNSYTHCNDVPGLVRALAADAGYPPPAVAMVAPGGQTLEGHLQDPEALAAIARGGWDVVVLQEQSLRPALAEDLPDHRQAFLAGAVALYDRIAASSPGAAVVLYETWARHPEYWLTDPDPNAGRDAADMQARLRKWYGRAAEAILTRGARSVVVAPAGDAWERHYREPGATRLHTEDNSHPEPAGSALAAQALFAAIYRRAPKA